jgi:prolyl oligopeptidase PreP (S9A serine peptidase family)
VPARSSPTADPYCWLEEPASAETRDWIKQRSAHAREFLDPFPGRERFAARVVERRDPGQS